MSEELREGFEAWALSRGMYVAREHKAQGYADSYANHMWIGWQAALAYIRQHASHAEFVRAVKALCIDRALHRHEKLDEIESLCDRALCDAELAKEQLK